HMEDQNTQGGMRLSGKLIDANGRVGTLTMAISADNRASWVLHLAERDGPPVELKGELKLKIEGTKLQMKGSEKVQGKEVTWELDLTRHPAAAYAREAFVGQYSTTGGGNMLPLSSGVVVLWAFK
ncbi:MAG: hypothetical protein ABIT38_23200, partial [Gemmatimonadaceae bacterium]